jgi:hypothetical protein
MTAVGVSDSEKLFHATTLVLKVRWPHSSLFLAGEDGRSIQPIHREKPDTVMFAFDSAPVHSFDLEDGRQSHGP